ncbi:Transposase IS66 family, partial [Acididesulfobacillus acetoxydans]
LCRSCRLPDPGTHWHVDETRWMLIAEKGGKQGYRRWLWTFVSEPATVFVLCFQNVGRSKTFQNILYFVTSKCILINKQMLKMNWR